MDDERTQFDLLHNHDGINSQKIRAINIIGSNLSVGDGTTTVTSVTDIEFSGVTVTNGGSGIVDVTINTEQDDWQFNGTFSATDSDTVAWTSGTLISRDGTTYSINSGNTGNISALTYIYFDSATSTTAFQTTTTPATAVGGGKILIGIAKNQSGTNATFQIYGGSGGVRILGTGIAPAGSDTQVQYNDGGVLGADAQFTWTKGTYTLGLGILNGTANITTPAGGSANNGGCALASTTGAGSGTGPGGNYTITTGAGGTNSSGGTYAVTTGLGVSTGLGGDATFNLGKGGVTARGGLFSVTTGQGGNTSGTGGSISLTTGRGNGTGSGGAINISSGDGGNTSGNGGIITITGGSANNTGNTGGDIILVPGARFTTGTNGFVKIKTAPNYFVGTLSTTNLTAARTFEYPDTSGTLALVGGTGSFTNTRVPFANSSGILVDDADMTFVTDTLTVTKLSTSQVTDSGLTNTRITFAGASGLLSDSANLTWSSPALTIGVANSTTGALKMTGATSGTVTTTVAATAGTWTFTLPTSGGTSGYLLQTDGSGITSWVQSSYNTQVVSLTSQTADIGSTNLTTTGNGLYRLAYYLVDTTADALAGAVRLNVTYTDAGASQTQQSATVLLTTLGAFTQGEFIIQLASGNIAYSTSHTGIFGTAAYNLYMTLERLN